MFDFSKNIFLRLSLPKETMIKAYRFFARMFWADPMFVSPFSLIFFWLKKIQSFANASRSTFPTSSWMALLELSHDHILNNISHIRRLFPDI
jgi:hypothetical protein